MRKRKSTLPVKSFFGPKPLLVLVFCLLLLLITSGRMTAVTRAAAVRPGLYVLPTAAASGAELYVSGHGLGTGGLDLVVKLTNQETNEVTELGLVMTSGEGLLQTMLSLPPVRAGSYTLAVWDDEGALASAPLTVLPALSLALDTSGDPPGTVVPFTVQNIIPGSVRLDYDGVPVLGPLPVGNGTYSSSFIVPHDRPETSGEMVMVTAVNLVAGRVVGQAEIPFQSEPSPSSVTYQLTDLVLPDEELLSGDPFTLSGRITPPPAGALDRYQVRVLWRNESGQIIPISNGPATIEADGSFVATAHMPSLLQGDAESAYFGAQLGVVLSVSDSQKVQDTMTEIPGPLFLGGYGLRVQVVNEANEPIEGAIVRISKFTPDKSGIQALSANLHEYDQVYTFSSQIFAPDPNPFTCPNTDYYGRTGADGVFQVQFDPETFATLGGVQEVLSDGTVVPFPIKVEIPIEVNAAYQGYSHVENGQPVAFHKILEYRPNEAGFFYDPETNAPLNSYLVVLPALPDGIEPGMPIEPYVPGAEIARGFTNFKGSGAPLTVAKKFLSFSDATLYPANIFSPAPPPLRVSFQHDAAIYGSLDNNKVHLFLNGQKYNFSPDSGANPCNGTTYTTEIPNPHRFKAGYHEARIEAHAVDGTVSERYLWLNYVEPPAWIGHPSYKNRKIEITNSYSPSPGYRVKLEGMQVPANDPHNTTPLGANVPKVGYLNNSAGAGDFLRQTINIQNKVESHYNSNFNSQVLNENAPPQNEVLTPKNNQTLTFGDKITVLDTPRMRLFQYVWGIPPIAGATLTADFWFDAVLTYKGTVTFNPHAAPKNTLLVRPEATVNVETEFDVSALFGLIRATASALPEITVKLPVEFTNGSKTDDEICFRYALYVAWSTRIGPCIDTPLGSTCYKDSGTEKIFDDYTPKTPLCAPVQLHSRLLGNTVSPSSVPVMASDGFGHTLAVWRTEEGDIISSAYNGLAWEEVMVVTDNHASVDPDVTFFAPNQALAVWAESSLTAEEAETATLAEAVQAQYLAYATWDGISWSIPQSLTAPTTGEGLVALAGCVAATPFCGDGVATAVWVRDIAGDMSQRRFRLFYATYAGGLWSTPQPVDSTSTATDAEADVTYVNGGPVVVWVRDDDRDINTLDDHHLAYRFLNARSFKVYEPTEFPTGLVEPAVAGGDDGLIKLAFTVAEDEGAFSGNQRRLYTAVNPCSDCLWQIQALEDSHGRAIRAENPQLALDAEGKGIVTFRSLGFGPVSGGDFLSFPEDTLGTVMGVGDLAQVEVDFAAAAQTPHYLTNSAALTWQPAAVYDPFLKQVHAMVVEGLQTAVPAHLQQRQDIAVSGEAAATRFAEDHPVLFATLPRLPDFAVTSLAPETRYPQEGESFTVTAVVGNDGLGWQETDGQLLDVVATWDGPPGVGTSAGQIQIGALAAGQPLAFTFAVTLPDNVDYTHELYVTINPAQSIAEQKATNNTLTTAVGGLPAPENIVPSALATEPVIHLQWTAPDDSRIAGYRIYRATGDGAFEPVGSTFVAGFADLAASPNRRYRYAVTSYTAEGVESDFGDIMEFTRDTPLAYLPVIIR